MEKDFTTNSYRLLFRCIGELPSTQELSDLFEIAPTHAFRKGDKRNKVTIQQNDVFIVELALWKGDSNTKDVLLQHVPFVESLATKTALLDRTRCVLEIYITSFRETDQGGMVIPKEFIKAVAQADLPISISIPVYIEDEPTA